MTTKNSTTQVPGNTIPGPCVKSRSFQLTINKIDTYDNIKDYLINLKSFSYLISCKENAPTTNKEHIHIYTHFKQLIKLSLKKTLGAHIEKCKGSPEQNIKYITKDGNILDEIGERPHQGKKNFNFEEINNLTTEEILNNEDLNLIQKKTLLNIKKDISNKPISLKDYKKNIEVYYIYGKTGTGKTNKALQIIQDKGFENFDEVKYTNKFYIGASGLSKCCLYDEFRDSHMSITEFINFIDYNKHNMNTKGGFIRNNYELIIITSVKNPNNIYNNVIDAEETIGQILRRIKIIHLE